MIDRFAVIRVCQGGQAYGEILSRHATPAHARMEMHRLERTGLPWFDKYPMVRELAADWQVGARVQWKLLRDFTHGD